MAIQNVHDLQDPKSLAVVIQKARKKGAQGQFVFLFKSPALDGGPALLLSEPGKPINMPLAKAISKGGKPIRGRYEGEDQKIVLLPRQEVNASRILRAMKKIHKELKAGRVIVRPPSEVEAAEVAEAEKKAGITRKLEEQDVSGRSQVALIKDGIAQIKARVAIGDTSVVREARSQLKVLLKQGFPLPKLPYDAAAVPAELEAVGGAPDSALEVAREAARVAFVGADQASHHLKRLELAQQQLQTLLEAAMVSADTDNSRALAIKARLELNANDIVRAREVIEQKARAMAVFRLEQQRALEGRWTDEQRAQLAELQAASAEHAAALEALDKRDDEITQAQADNAAALDAATQQQAACWERLNAAEAEVDQCDEKLAKLRADLKSISGKSRDAERAQLQRLISQEETLRMVRVEAAELREREAEAAEEAVLVARGDQLALIAGGVDVGLEMNQREAEGAHMRLEAAEHTLEGLQQQHQELLAKIAGGLGRADEVAALEAEIEQLDAARAAEAAAVEAARSARAKMQVQLQTLETDNRLESTPPSVQQANLAAIVSLRSELIAAEQDLSVLQGRLAEMTLLQRERRSGLDDLRDELVAGAAEQGIPEHGQLLDVMSAEARARDEAATATAELSAAMERIDQINRDEEVSTLTEELQLLVEDPRFIELEKAAAKYTDSKAAKASRKLGKMVDELELSETMNQIMVKISRLQRAGATPQQLLQIWDQIPDALTPDSQVRDLQNWIRLQEQLDREMERHQKKRHGNRAEIYGELQQKAEDKLVTARSAALTGVAVLASPDNIRSMSDALLSSKVITEAIPEDLIPVIGPVLKLTAALSKIDGLVHAATQAEGNALEAGIALAGSSTVDPIEKLMMQEELVEALESLLKTAVTTGLSIAGTVLPFIGAAAPSIDALSHAVEAIQRAQLAVKDAALEKTSKKLDSTLTAAVQQSKNREATLTGTEVVRALSKGAMAAGKITGDIGTFTAAGDMGATKAAGLAVKVSGTVVYYGTAVVTQVKDWGVAAYCADLNDKARAGDRRAQKKIFKHSGKHAKGLIALMARDRDPVALAYIKSRGLTPEMIEKSSPEIIRMYLLRRAGESDFSFDRTLVDEVLDGLKLIPRGASRTKRGIASAGQKIKDRYDGIDRKAWEKNARIDTAPFADLSAQIDAVKTMQSTLSSSPVGSDAYREARDEVAGLEDALRGLRGELLALLPGLHDKLAEAEIASIHARQKIDAMEQQQAALGQALAARGPVSAELSEAFDALMQTIDSKRRVKEGDDRSSLKKAAKSRYKDARAAGLIQCEDADGFRAALDEQAGLLRGALHQIGEVV